jgi:hypothetical protein
MQAKKKKRTANQFLTAYPVLLVSRLHSQYLQNKLCYDLFITEYVPVTNVTKITKYLNGKKKNSFLGYAATFSLTFMLPEGNHCVDKSLPLEQSSLTSTTYAIPLSPP